MRDNTCAQKVMSGGCWQGLGCTEVSWGAAMSHGFQEQVGSGCVSRVARDSSQDRGNCHSRNYVVSPLSDKHQPMILFFTVDELQHSRGEPQNLSGKEVVCVRAHGYVCACVRVRLCLGGKTLLQDDRRSLKAPKCILKIVGGNRCIKGNIRGCLSQRGLL